MIIYITLWGGTEPRPKVGAAPGTSDMNQGDIESDMDLRTEETKAEVKGEVEGQKNPESVLFQPMWGTPPRGSARGL